RLHHLEFLERSRRRALRELVRKQKIPRITVADFFHVKFFSDPPDVFKQYYFHGLLIAARKPSAAPAYGYSTLTVVAIRRERSNLVLVFVPNFTVPFLPAYNVS